VSSATAGLSLVDLHLHTTASDGHCTPSELVDRARRACVSVMAVTDHDTVAAIAEVQSVADASGIDAVAGIELTAVEGGRDVHMLGYFIDPRHTGLGTFLSRQRAQRIARVEALGLRLAQLGMPIDIGPLLTQAREQGGGRSVGRPQIAAAMIAAGYVADTREAFDRWLATGRPAFVPRHGVPPAEVIGIVHAAGGLASLAHPGQTEVDSRIAAYAEAGLDAIEVYHPDHEADAVDRYRGIASRLKLLVTGGSDFHGDADHGYEPGTIALPLDDWIRLRNAARA
jgi:predicted metal-dependent phosphoesterase TrpH